MERALAATFQQLCVHQPLQVVAQGRGGQVDTGLNVTRCRAPVSRLHDETQDREANGVTERAQLFGVTVELRRHRLFLTNSKYLASPISSIMEITWRQPEPRRHGRPKPTHRESRRYACCFRARRDRRALLSPAEIPSLRAPGVSQR